MNIVIPDVWIYMTSRKKTYINVFKTVLTLLDNFASSKLETIYLDYDASLQFAVEDLFKNVNIIISI